LERGLVTCVTGLTESASCLSPSGSAFRPGLATAAGPRLRDAEGQGGQHLSRDLLSGSPRNAPRWALSARPLPDAEPGRESYRRVPATLSTTTCSGACAADGCGCRVCRGTLRNLSGGHRGQGPSIVVGEPATWRAGRMLSQVRAEGRSARCRASRASRLRRSRRTSCGPCGGAVPPLRFGLE
jgi:hypothetical protein